MPRCRALNSPLFYVSCSFSVKVTKFNKTRLKIINMLDGWITDIPILMMHQNWILHWKFLPGPGSKVTAATLSSNQLPNAKFTIFLVESSSWEIDLYFALRFFRTHTRELALYCLAFPTSITTFDLGDWPHHIICLALTLVMVVPFMSWWLTCVCLCLPLSVASLWDLVMVLYY